LTHLPLSLTLLLENLMAISNVQTGSVGVRYLAKQSAGHAHHWRSGAGTFDQRPDSVGTAVDLPDAQGKIMA
jgi:hypothetical protein